jgi:hypothetical protein
MHWRFSAPEKFTAGCHVARFSLSIMVERQCGALGSPFPGRIDSEGGPAPHRRLGLYGDGTDMFRFWEG